MAKNEHVKKNDPGFGNHYSKKTRRVINRDGSFNVIKRGTSFSFRDMYLLMVNMSWPKFMSLIVGTYFGLNAIFALLYLMAGVDHIQGANPDYEGGDFLQAFFFSVQTFTTVGYGAMSPMGLVTNIIASIEAMFGLLGFALTSGLLYGRFSKPSARIKYSENAIIAPFRGESALMFRIANYRTNLLLNIEARVLVMFTDLSNGEYRRRFSELPLEVDMINFFTLTWTLVHPIDEDSPLFGKTAEQCAAEDMEILVLIKGFDDTFSQEVHSRYSYKHDEIVHGAKFKPAFAPNEEGYIVLDLDELNSYKKV